MVRCSETCSWVRTHLCTQLPLPLAHGLQLRAQHRVLVLHSRDRTLGVQDVALGSGKVALSSLELGFRWGAGRFETVLELELDPGEQPPEGYVAFDDPLKQGAAKGEALARRRTLARLMPIQNCIAI